MRLHWLLRQHSFLWQWCITMQTEFVARILASLRVIISPFEVAGLTHGRVVALRAGEPPQCRSLPLPLLSQSPTKRSQNLPS
jgi:hypothetical protein